jgi:hypothetical protein
MNSFFKVVSLLERKTITFPDLESLREALTAALICYYGQVEGLSMESIKKKIDFDFSINSSLKKIGELNENMRARVSNILAQELGNGD